MGIRMPYGVQLGLFHFDRNYSNKWIFSITWSTFNQRKNVHLVAFIRWNIFVILFSNGSFSNYITSNVGLSPRYNIICGNSDHKCSCMILFVRIKIFGSRTSWTVLVKWWFSEQTKAPWPEQIMYMEMKFRSDVIFPPIKFPWSEYLILIITLAFRLTANNQ